MASVEKRVVCKCGRTEYVTLRADEKLRLMRAMRSRRWSFDGLRWTCQRCLEKAAQPTDAQRADALAAELAALRGVLRLLLRSEAARLCVAPETHAETVALCRRRAGDEAGAAAVEAALKGGE